MIHEEGHLLNQFLRPDAIERRRPIPFEKIRCGVLTAVF